MTSFKDYINESTKYMYESDGVPDSVKKNVADVDVDEDNGFDVPALKKAARANKYVKVPDDIDMDELMDSYSTGFKVEKSGYYPAKYILKHLQSAD